MDEKQITEKFAGLPEDAAPEAIERTAAELRMQNFSPNLLVETPGFTSMTRAEVTAEAVRVNELPDDRLPPFNPDSFEGADAFRQRQVELLHYYFELLTRLRRDEPEAWDFVHELYEDD